jgi:hypothetical protein
MGAPMNSHPRDGHPFAEVAEDHAAGLASSLTNLAAYVEQ